VDFSLTESERDLVGLCLVTYIDAVHKSLFAGFLRPEDAMNILVVGAQSDLP
jgi:hypothetical protein